MDIWILFLSFFIAGAVDSLIAASLAQLYRETVMHCFRLYLSAVLKFARPSTALQYRRSSCRTSLGRILNVYNTKFGQYLKAFFTFDRKTKKTSQNCVLNMNCIPWLLIFGKSFPLWNRIRDRFNEFSFVVVKIDTWKMSTDRDQ